MKIKITFLLTILILFFSQNLFSQETLENILNSLVKIRVLKTEDHNINEKGLYETNYEYGSGFYISKKGLILTAAHVLKDRSKTVYDPIICMDMFSGSVFSPIILYLNYEIDIALIQNAKYIVYNEELNTYIDIFSKVGNIKMGLRCYSVGFPNEIQKYNSICSISSGQIDKIDFNLQGYKKLPRRENVVVASCEVIPGTSGGLIFDEFFNPLGILLGSIEEGNKKLCYFRQFSDIKNILNEFKE